jgi:hypothetical protein
MPRYKIINNETIQFTAAEEAAKDVQEQAWSDGAFNRSMTDLRRKRNSLLIECDWTVLEDSPIADKTAWQTYRTELRDLTNGLSTVEEVEAVVWPTKPE